MNSETVEQMCINLQEEHFGKEETEPCCFCSKQRRNTAIINWSQTGNVPLLTYTYLLLKDAGLSSEITRQIDYARDYIADPTRVTRYVSGYTTYLKGFCSKKCLIDFLITNRSKLLELITQ